MISIGDFQPGKALHLPLSDRLISHLYIVLTKPEGNPLRCVMVNLTTKRNNSDLTCVLDRDDHSFIKHPTVVNYKDANFINIESLKCYLEQKTINTFYNDFDGHILLKIQSGLLRSRFTSNNIKEYCRTRFNLPSSD